MDLTYLYNIIPAGKGPDIDIAGLDQQKVRAITHNNIAAVVGGSPLADYHGLDRQQAVRYLLAHQRVVEAVLRDHVVLPVKFGTVLPDRQRVCDLLTQGEDLFCRAMDELADQVQLEVIVLWNLQDVFKEVAEDEAVVQLKTQAAAQAQEESLDGRIAVGKAVYDLLERRRSTLRDAVISALREMGGDLIVNPNMDDSMVANLALLVGRDNCELLDQRLQTLDGQFEGLLNFRRIGPLPPCSFATVEIRVPVFEEVDKARRLLELGERHDRNGIKQAYRRLAGQIHPDICPDDSEADGLSSEIASAYRLLMSYADSASCSFGDGEPAVCGFDRQTVARTLMIGLRRQESQV